MKPIEEDQDKNHVSELAYICIFQRCHDDLKFMQIGEKSEDDFFKSPAQLQNAHMVIKNVKNWAKVVYMSLNGVYPLIDKWHHGLIIILVSYLIEYPLIV